VIRGHWFNAPLELFFFFFRILLFPFSFFVYIFELLQHEHHQQRGTFSFFLKVLLELNVFLFSLLLFISAANQKIISLLLWKSWPKKVCC